MATLLDISIIDYFRPIFVFIFIFVLLYAILQKTEILGKETKNLNTFAALSIAVLSLFTGKITELVSTVAPWVVAVFIGVVMIFMILLFFGVKEEDAWSYVGGKWLPVIIIILIFVIGVSQVLTLSPLEEGGAAGTSAYRQEIIKTLVSPKVLGAIFLIAIMAAAAKLIVDGIKSK